MFEILLFMLLSFLIIWFYCVYSESMPFEYYFNYSVWFYFCLFPRLWIIWAWCIWGQSEILGEFSEGKRQKQNTDMKPLGNACWSMSHQNEQIGKSVLALRGYPTLGLEQIWMIGFWNHSRKLDLRSSMALKPTFECYLTITGDPPHFVLNGTLVRSDVSCLYCQNLQGYQVIFHSDPVSLVIPYQLCVFV